MEEVAGEFGEMDGVADIPGLRLVPPFSLLTPIIVQNSRKFIV
jgi:hypothetical protein